jgi:predicted metal-dependent hydrolase
MKRLWRVLSVRGRGRGQSPRPSPRRTAYLNHKEAARAFLLPMIASEASLIGVTYVRVSIKDTKRSWGSCSAKGNLNFHYKLLFLPEHLTRYVVIHELCHRKHLNHSADFWAEVALWCPTYEASRRELRHIERTIGMGREALLAYRVQQSSTTPIFSPNTAEQTMSASDILATL